MPTAEDVAVVRRLDVAVAAGALADVAACFHEEAVWHLPGHSGLAGTLRGWAAIRDDQLAKQVLLSGGPFRPVLLDLAVGDEYIVAVVRATAEHDGRRLDQTACQLPRVREGKIVELRGHYGDEASLDAFWGS